MTSAMFVGLASVHITRTLPFTLHQTTAWSPDHTDVCPLKLAVPSARRQLDVSLWISKFFKTAGKLLPVGLKVTQIYAAAGCWATSRL